MDTGTIVEIMLVVITSFGTLISAFVMHMVRGIKEDIKTLYRKDEKQGNEIADIRVKIAELKTVLK